MVCVRKLYLNLSFGCTYTDKNLCITFIHAHRHITSSAWCAFLVQPSSNSTARVYCMEKVHKKKTHTYARTYTFSLSLSRSLRRLIKRTHIFIQYSYEHRSSNTHINCRQKFASFSFQFYKSRSNCVFINNDDDENNNKNEINSKI